MTDIAKKIISVMTTCNGLAKDAFNSDVGYPYVTAAKLVDTVNGALTNAGIATSAESKLLDIREVHTAKGTTETLATVEVTVTLIDGDSGETLTLKGIGSGLDFSDKSVAKAQTMALKYALKCGLLIADASDDPDAVNGKIERFKPSTHKPTQAPSNTPPRGSQCAKTAIENIVVPF